MNDDRYRNGWGVIDPQWCSKHNVLFKTPTCGLCWAEKERQRVLNDAEARNKVDAMMDANRKTAKDD
jgi:hypothetical protein